MHIFQWQFIHGIKYSKKRIIISNNIKKKFQIKVKCILNVKVIKDLHQAITKKIELLWRIKLVIREWI